MPDIKITDVVSKDTTGVFNTLSAKVLSELDNQYSKQRLKGAEYSKVYAALMDSLLQQSIAFVLSEQEASAKADLLSQQLLNAQSENLSIQAITDKTLKETLAVEAGTVKLIQEQETEQLRQLALVQETKLMKERVQTEKLTHVAMGHQNAKLLKEVDLMSAQIDKMVEDAKNAKAGRQVTEIQRYVEFAKISDNPSAWETPPITIGGMFKEQVNKDISEISLNTSRKRLIQQQRLTEVAQLDGQFIQPDSLLDIQRKASAKDLLIKDANIGKVANERELIAQKVLTERANTSSEGIADDSLLGAQIIGSTKNNLKTDKEIELIQYKVHTEKANTDATDVVDGSFMDEKISHMQQEALKMAGEVTLMTAKVKSEEANTDGTGVTADSVIGSQIDKQTKEAALLFQKSVSEKANVEQENIDSGSLYGSQISKLVKEKAVMDKQIEGFEWDAQLRLTKLYADLHAVSIASVEDPDTFAVTAATATGVLNAAKASVNL